MLRDKLQADQVAALKSGDKVKLVTLRYVLSAIKNKEIEKKDVLNDEEVLTVLRKNVKELKESVEAFIKGGRKDLATEYEQQLGVITPYLPAELSDADLNKMIDDIIAQNQNIAQTNAIIGVCMRELKNKAEPGRIMTALRSRTGKA